MIQIKNWSSLQSYKDRKPPWIRLHKSLLDNFEYHSMSVQARALLPMLWLLASEHKDPTSGKIEYDYEKIAFRLRCDFTEICNSIIEIEQAGFIETNQQVTNPLRIGYETVTPETETETETEEEKSLKEKTAFDIFILFAKENNLSIPAKLTNTRKSKLKARLKDCGGLEGWKIALEKLKNSSFCMGKVNNFKANLDFLLQEKSFTKLMEGAYDDNKNRENTTKKPTESMFTGFAQATVENSEVW